MIKLEPRRRTFLFLQGLASDFFSRLGAQLAARGHGVLRVNLNAGDRMFWRLPGALNYRGTAQDWPAYVAELMAERQVTDLVLFGDCRPLHRAAIDAAAGQHVAVHVIEEGYLRPDWVTVELGGVNGHSSLPRDPAWYRETAAGLPEIQEIPAIPSSFRRRAREDLVYNISAMALAFLHPHYQTHRPWHPLVEYAGWAGRLLRQSGRRRRAARTVQRLVAGADYFLFPLQLDCDSQIRLHSSFSGMRGAIETVLASFAAAAPAHAMLAIKEHPLDNGLVNWRRFTLAAAERLGVLDRLVYLEDGDIARLVRDARGVVTVNSTSGTLALASGVPVVTLGTAIYDIQGLTFQGELSEFWTAPVAPDAALYEAFRKVLVQRCLVRGGFFSEQGLGMLVEGAVARMEAVTPAPALSRSPVATAAAAHATGYQMDPAVAAPARQ
jgi:capsular polysaccharide export protein